MDKEELFALWLCNIDGIGARKIAAIKEYFGSLADAFCGSESQFAKVKNLTANDKKQIIYRQNMELLKREKQNLDQKKISFVWLDSKDYPKKLKEIFDPPYGLFYKGSLPLENTPCVAVVGAREATDEGRMLAKQFGSDLAKNGIQVVSGMARGVDIFAQKGALNVNGGRTFGILGTGVDVCYPQQNEKDYIAMQKNGGVISEFALGTPGYPGNFPLRNRIISAFSDGILVIEAREGSGSLITAKCGLEQGKEIFVLPGSITDRRCAGGNELIKSGAALVTCVRDILDGLGLFYDSDVTAKKKNMRDLLETREKIVYDCLSLEPKHISLLTEQTGISLIELLKILDSLSEKKMLRITGNNYYSIRL